MHDENTDPNGNLGVPSNYITKADFSDSRVEQTGERLSGGTIETFLNKNDCQNRADYLKKMSNSSMGAFGVNQYIYEYDLSVFRVSYDLTSEQAEEYHEQMTEIINEWEKTGEIPLNNDKTKNTTVKEADEIFETFKQNIIDMSKDLGNSDIEKGLYYKELLNSSPAVKKLTPETWNESEEFNDFLISVGYFYTHYEEGSLGYELGNTGFELAKHLMQGDNNFEEDMDSLEELLKKIKSEEGNTTEELETVNSELIALSTGNYVVGEDIPAGKYDIIGVDSGNVYVSSNGGKSSNVLIESIVPGETVYKNLKLEDGYIVEIVLGGKVRLEPK